MTLEIGKKIKALRLKKGITQEELANELLLAPQSVSKWENNQTTPDISLLPQLSALLGVTIDELFAITDDTHFTRIENMLDDKRFLSDDDFHYAYDFLQEKQKDASKKSQALTLLAQLHNHRAEEHHILAKELAKQSLELNPESKDNHTALKDAANGAAVDWDYSNHHELIAYYQQFVKDHPKYRSGYLWLLDNLIADGRCIEAKTALEAMKQTNPGYLYPLYKGMIAKEEGDHATALKLWDDMTKEYPDNWLTWFSYGDCMVRLTRYEEAIKAYTKSFELQPKPRYTDAYLSIAHIYEILGQKENAIKTYQANIELLDKEWHITEGETVDFFAREVVRLK